LRGRAVDLVTCRPEVMSLLVDVEAGTDINAWLLGRPKDILPPGVHWEDTAVTFLEAAQNQNGCKRFFLDIVRHSDLGAFRSQIKATGLVLNSCFAGGHFWPRLVQPADTEKIIILQGPDCTYAAGGAQVGDMVVFTDPPAGMPAVINEKLCAYLGLKAPVIHHLSLLGDKDSFSGAKATLTGSFARINAGDLPTAEAAYISSEHIYLDLNYKDIAGRAKLRLERKLWNVVRAAIAAPVLVLLLISALMGASKGSLWLWNAIMKQERRQLQTYSTSVDQRKVLLNQWKGAAAVLEKQSNFAGLMHEIGSALPSNVWFSEINAEKPKTGAGLYTILAIGHAPDPDAVAKTAAQLERAKGVAAVRVVYTEALGRQRIRGLAGSSIAGQELVRFKLEISAGDRLGAAKQEGIPR